MAIANVRNDNANGRPRSTKATLIEAFLEAMLDDFTKCGKAVVRKVREETPVQFLRLIATLIPKSWFGEEPEAKPAPMLPQERKHVRVRSPHQYR